MACKLNTVTAEEGRATPGRSCLQVSANSSTKLSERQQLRTSVTRTEKVSQEKPNETWRPADPSHSPPQSVSVLSKRR